MTTTTTQPAPDIVSAGPGFSAGLPEMLSALAVLGTAVSVHPPWPVLGGVLVTCDVDGVRLSCFDGETAVTVTLPDAAGTDRPTRVLLQFAELNKVIKAAIKGESKRTVTDWDVTVTSRIRTGVRVGPAGKVGEPFTDAEADVCVGGFTVPLTTLSEIDFPNLPPAVPTTVTFDRDLLLDRLARVSGAAGRDYTLPELAGVQLEMSGGLLTLCCTNRYQLAVATLPTDNRSMNGTWIAPAAELHSLVKALPSGPVQLGLPDPGDWSAAQATLRAGNVVATLRLLDAEFPRWRQLLNTASVCTVDADRTSLRKAIDRARALANALNDSNGRMWLHIADGAITVAPDHGEHRDRVRGLSVPADVTGEAVSVLFTSTYLSGAVGAFGGDRIAVNLAGPNKPVLLADSPQLLADGGAPLRVLVMTARTATS